MVIMVKVEEDPLKKGEIFCIRALDQETNDEITTECYKVKVDGRVSQSFIEAFNESRRNVIEKDPEEWNTNDVFDDFESKIGAFLSKIPVTIRDVDM